MRWIDVSTLLLVLLAACAEAPAPLNSPHAHGATTVTVVDRDRRPVADARVDWSGENPISCAPQKPIGPSYDVGFTGTTDGAGQVRVPHDRYFVRALGSNGAIGFAALGPAAVTIEIDQTATIMVLPRCGEAPCPTLESNAVLEMNGVRCRVDLTPVDGHLAASGIPRGELTLTLFAATGTADERTTTVHVTIASDTTLTPELQRVSK